MGAAISFVQTLHKPPLEYELPSTLSETVMSNPFNQPTIIDDVLTRKSESLASSSG